MGTKQIIRSGLMGSAALAALGLTACANSNAATPRYGAQTHFDYEGTTCGTACAPSYGGVITSPVVHAPVVKRPAYRPAPAIVSHYDYEGVPCRTSKCGVSTGVVSSGVVSSGAISSGIISTGTTSVISTPGYSHEVAPCPVGTSSQPDGTCLQGGGHIGSSIISGGSTHIGSSYSSSYSSGSITSSGSVADCPTGTTPQPDGSCLQRGSSFSGYSSSTYTAPVTSSYSSSTYIPPTSTYVAPELTTTCCGPTTSSTTVYSGDAVTSTHGGYATSGSTYSSSDYLPIRK